METIDAENLIGSFARVAVPIPCELAPTDRPIDKGSLTLSFVKMLSDVIDPKIPVMTTSNAVNVVSAPVMRAPASAFHKEKGKGSKD